MMSSVPGHCASHDIMAAGELCGHVSGISTDTVFQTSRDENREVILWSKLSQRAGPQMARNNIFQRYS